METVFNGAVRVFEAVKRYVPKARVYQASSSEMFGDCGVEVQNEGTAFRPVSPYGVAKVASHYAAQYYRKVYGMGISCGILFNHESPRRGSEFVTQKIVKGLKEVVDGRREFITLGNLEAKRDWGHAKDYVDAMWRMCQVEPMDVAIGTGVSWTVGEFAKEVCGRLGLDFKEVVRVEEWEKRDGEIPVLTADPRRAERVLGWKAQTTFGELVDDMVKEAVLA